MDTTDDFFSSVLDAAPDGILIVDAGGAISFANRQASELFGLAHDDLLGSSVDELLPEDARATHRAHRLRYRAEPTVRPMGVEMRLRARRGDGSELPVEVSLSPLVEAAEFHVVAVVRDVTARVRADESMRQVLLTLDATEDAVFIMEAASLQFSYVNDGASRQVGYPRDELLGMTPMHINPDLSEMGFRQLIDGIVADEQSAVSLRTVHRRRDGEDVPVEMSLHATPVGQDGRSSIIAVARDISGRLDAEARVRRGELAMQQADRAMAIADERERIAHDLHDTVIQRLFASGLALQAVMARVDPEMGDRLDAVVSDLDQTIHEIRTAIFALQPTAPAPAGLRAAILAIVGEARDTLGHEPDVEFDGPIEQADPQITAQVLPTLREALGHVARHAGAQRIRVTVEAGDGSFTLRVQDDGANQVDGDDQVDELGALRERATRLGGTVTSRAIEPTGTELVWTVPTD